MLQMAKEMDATRAENLERSVKEKMADYIDNYYRHGAHFRFLIIEFAHLLGRNYWTRVWIIQEFAVSPKLQIRCGQFTIPFEYLQVTYMFLRLATHEISGRLRKQLGTGDWMNDPNITILSSVFMSGIPSADGKAPQIMGMRQTYQNAGPEAQSTRASLAHILASVYVSGTLGATDQRDRIYALLGMAGDVDALELRTEYDPAVSCETVFTSAARAMLTTGHVDLLAFSQFSVDRRQKPPAELARELPSWVPDWRTSILEPYGGRILVSGETPFVASGELAFKKPQSFQNDVPKDCVKLLGFRVDVVEAIAGEWGTEPSLSSLEERRAYLSDIEEFCRRSDAMKEETGVDVYLKSSDRQDARAFVPVAGQGIYGVGFRGRATQAVRDGYSLTLDDIRRRARGDDPEFDLRPRDYYHSLMASQRFRRPFLSAKGFVGLVPGNSLPGDLIVVFLGGKLPYVLRGDEHVKEGYSFVGEAYVHGIMYGELSDRDPVIEEIVLK